MKDAESKTRNIQTKLGKVDVLAFTSQAPQIDPPFTPSQIEDENYEDEDEN